MERVIVQAQLFRLEQRQFKVELAEYTVNLAGLNLVGEDFKKLPGSRDAQIKVV